ncbi:hypothetical protein GCM10023205_84960 [Yinghuangia aomiensis]|uniref:SdpI/YhfL protein family protein n=1 Tax=Yinghuangia aomiensis TaxID=676205 RepID=A0ABP9IJ81_9ACTN
MDYLIAAFGLASCAGTAWLTARVWNDPGYIRYAQIAFNPFPFNAETKRGLVRALALTSAQSGFLGLAFVASALWGSDALWVSMGCVVATMLAVVLQVVVVWTNRPRWIVPPHMRNEPGRGRASQAA